MVENDVKDTSKYLPTLCVKKIIFVNVQVKVIYQVIQGRRELSEIWNYIKNINDKYKAQQIKKQF